MLNAALVLLGALSADSDSVLKRGAPVPSGPALTIGQILADPEKYNSEMVVIEGIVIRACSSMGCWMQLADGADAEGIQAYFHTAGFVIPVGAAGMKARAQGTVRVRVVSAADAEHLESLGARIKKNDKGKLVEVGLKATGVELYYLD